ncbi:lysine-sensitive aspartokinase 3 [soil metagenome]
MPDLIKVAKFGGTSMADAEAMRRSAAIVTQDPDKRLIVVSATSGTTNLLTSLCNSIALSEKQDLFEIIRDKHLAICDQLKNPALALKQVNKTLEQLKKFSEMQVIGSREKDEILSAGERIASIIFTEIINEMEPGAIWFDAREVMITNNMHGNAEPDIEAIDQQVTEKLEQVLKRSRVITQGFVGATKTGVTTTLGRGGSDYSAALLAEALNADVLEIWTDVTAIFTTDPRIEPDALPITEISFDEAAELSVFGAKVLHPATLKPAIRKSIRVYVGSSYNPNQPGTWIVKETGEKPVIRAISLRRNQTLLTVHSLDMLHRHGYLARLFEVLAKYKISVDLVTTSEVSVSMTLDTDIQSVEKNKLSEKVLSELRTFCDVNIEKNLALVALVGNDLHATAGLSGPVFGALKDINIRLICHGASSHNLCFLVKEEKGEETVRTLHQMFINSKNSTFKS